MFEHCVVQLNQKITVCFTAQFVELGKSGLVLRNDTSIITCHFLRKGLTHHRHGALFVQAPVVVVQRGMVDQAFPMMVVENLAGKLHGIR
jgi:hypothetical protein